MCLRKYSFEILITSFFLVALILLSSCNNANKFERNIGKFCDSNCDNYPCVIDLRVVFNFEWDEVFIFGCNSTIRDVGRYMGFYKTTDCPEFCRRTYFLKNKELIRYAEAECSVSTPDLGSVYFTSFGESIYVYCHYTDCKFEVIKESVDDDYIYILTKINK
jgi:hypothetical protein